MISQFKPGLLARLSKALSGYQTWVKHSTKAAHRTYGKPRIALSGQYINPYQGGSYSSNRNYGRYISGFKKAYRGYKRATRTPYKRYRYKRRSYTRYRRPTYGYQRIHKGKKTYRKKKRTSRYFS